VSIRIGNSRTKSHPWAVGAGSPGEDKRVPVERCYPRNFFELECNSLWKSAWQAAC
jgi:hypothetical protein